MTQENGIVEVGETITNDSQIKLTTTASPDDIPIGGSKFNFSEYPSENDMPPPKKPVARKPLKAGKKDQTAQEKKQQMPIKNNMPLDQIPVGGNNNTTGGFDDKPIPKGAFNLSQYPEGGEVQVAETTNYSMGQMLKSKANKLKLQGLEALLKMLEEDPSNPQLSEVVISGLLKETVPANVQKSLQCMQAWMKNERGWGEDEARNTIQSGYINGKANSKKQSVQIIDLMYEEKADCIEMVILSGFKSKTPKTIAGYNAMLNEIINIYGVKRLKYLKPYIPEVVRVIGAEKLAAVKTQGMNTLKQAYKWMSKQVVQPMLKDLKEALKKQLDTFWEGYDKTIVMKAPKDIPEEAGKNKGKKLDAYQLSEAVDIFKKYNEKWSETVINAPKWNQKTKMMEEFVKDATVPKLANTDFRPITEVIRRLINDSNFNVVLWVLKIIGVMAKGLRRPFAGAAKNNFANVIAKFRDKKTQMIEQTFKTLNDLAYCLAIEDVLEDVKEGLTDKAPTMRINMLAWIGKYVEQKAEEKGGEVPEKTKEGVKQLFSLFEKLLNDGTSEVRQAAARFVGKLQMICGEDFVYPIKLKMNKNLLDKAGSKIQQGGKPKSAKQKQEPPKKVDQLTKSQVGMKPPLANTSRLSQTKPVQKQQKKQQPKQQLECFDQPNYDQSLQTLIGLGYPQQEIKKLNATSASDRGTILAYFRQNPYENFNDVLRVIRKAYKDWKEVNLNMNKDLIAYLEERQSDISKPEAYVILPYIIQKVGDSKFAQPLTRLVTFICKGVPPKFIVGHIVKYVRSTEGKKPKLNGDACSFLVKIIEAVALSNCNIKQLAQFAKETYAVQFSKKGAAQLLVCMYSYIGDGLKAYLDEPTIKGMEPQFKATKSLPDDMKKAKIQFQGDAAVQCKALPIKKADSKTDGKARDLSNDILRLLPLMNDNGNWQKRRQAAQNLTALIEQGGKVSYGNTTNDLLATLKVRINDSCKTNIKTFVHLAGQVLCSLPEKQMKANARSFIVGMVQGLNDKSDVTRKQIHSALIRVSQVLGKEAILSNIGPFLEGDKEGRVQVLNLIINMEDGIAKAEIKDYVKGLANCLCDKNKEVRAGAERVFQKVFEKLGIESFRMIAKNLKPALATDLNNTLDRFDRNANTMSSSNFHSKGASPNKPGDSMIKGRMTMNNPPPTQSQISQQPPLSAKKRSLSRNATQKSFIETEDDPHAVTVSGNFFVGKRTLVEGNQFFANQKSLTSERIERQSNQQDYCWRLDQLKQSQQQSIREDIEKLIRGDIAKKMLSFDYKKVIEGVVTLNKLSKDLSYQDRIRELYDVLFKWILLRLWGGQPGVISIIELVAPILSILQKKKLALTDFQVQLIITIIRQYLISALMVCFKFSESLFAILKCLVSLSSGQRVLRKMLYQFTVELSTYHKHLKKENCQLYRQILSKLIKNQLIEYIGNSDTLEEVSKIKQLKEDPQFVQMLYRRLHESVLANFGFKRVAPLANSIAQKSTTQLNNASFTSDKDAKQKSLERLPQRGNDNTKTMGDLRPSNLPTAAPLRKNPPIQSQIVPPIERQGGPTSRFQQVEQMPKSSHNHPAYDYFRNNYQIQYLNISIYPAPHPASPLGKNLSKLLPPNQQIIGFFNSLFTENSDKITKQLIDNAKFIFGSILKSVYQILASRKDHQPDKVVAQITLLQNCIKCTHVIHNVGELIGFGTSFALTQLVYEDQRKADIIEELRSRNIEYKSQNFIKAVNGVMLRILEHANHQDIVNNLLEMLTIHSKVPQPSPKTISLIIKCLGRVSNSFCVGLRFESIKAFLIKANQYLASIQYDTALEQLNLALRQQNRERVRPEDSAANSIKTIIAEICNDKGSEIWQIYEKAMMESRFPDRYIASYLNSLNIRVPERPRGRSQARENEELKKINQLLSKTKSYQAGIVQLRRYVEKHPQFSPIEYFTSLNYDQKFIAMVVKSLEGNKSLTPSKERQEQNQENIQDKIQKLKRRFQELQPEPSVQENVIVPPANRKPMAEDQQREERAQEIKRRIEEMKNKMTSAVNRGRP